MAKNRKSSSKPDQDEPRDNDVPPLDAAPAEVPEPETSPRAAVTQLPDREIKLVAARAFITRRNQPLVRAFLLEESMKNGTRKLSRAEWAAAYQKFLEAPRG